MRWTLGLFLLGAVGCGYHQTKMVACPEGGCAPSYASASPEGLPESHATPAVKPLAPILPQAAPIEPLPDQTPPEPLPATP
jgi:hypothetical protein